MSKRGSVKFSSHPFSKNWSKKNKITPDNISISSHQFVWFKCPVCEHEFETSPSYLKNKTDYCPYCHKKKLCEYCHKCFKNSFAYEEKSLYLTDRNGISPTEIFISTQKKYEFKCPVCKHTFDTSPEYITKDGCFCPYCHHQKLCGDLDCDFCFENSFAYNNEHACVWSDKNEISPSDVFPNSHKKYLFKCPECKHEFPASLSNITSDDCFCPYCDNKKLCEYCDYCLKKSFAYDERSMYWSAKNKLVPAEVFRTSDNYFIFDCPDCDHEFKTKLRTMAQGSFCPYSSVPPKKLCDDNDCEHCYYNSFAAHPYAKNWSYKNKLTPRQVFRGSGKKYIFKCPDCKIEFMKRPNNIIYDSYCPICVNKTEKILHAFLKKHYKTVTHNKGFTWCKDIKELPFDFLISKYHLIIELDGPQHFMQVYKWQDYKKTQKRDVYKMKRANEHGYSVIRILQEDVLHNRNDWQNKLKDAIAKVLKDDDVANYCIGDIYSKHPIYFF